MKKLIPVGGTKDFKVKSKLMVSFCLTYGAAEVGLPSCSTYEEQKKHLALPVNMLLLCLGNGKLFSD